MIRERELPRSESIRLTEGEDPDASFPAPGVPLRMLPVQRAKRRDFHDS